MESHREIIDNYASAKSSFPVATFHSFCHDSSATVVSHDLDLKQARTANLSGLELEAVNKIHNAASQK